MTQPKPTPGPWIVYEPANDSHYPICVSARFGIGGESNMPIAMAALEANAALIAEAGTVYHETQLTPRQLLAQRDALLIAIDDAKNHFRLLLDDESCDIPIEAREKIEETINELEAIAAVKGGNTNV